MSQKALTRILRLVVIIAVIACIATDAVILSLEGRSNVPVRASIFFTAGILPLLAVAGYAWMLFAALGRGESFTHDNARLLHSMSIASLISALIWLVTLGIYALLIRPLAFSVVVSLVVALVFCISLTCVCAALSTLTEHAAALKDESDLVV